ncbi:hypothetical protein ACN28E_18490 [Archangium lansingense]|uniref:hypothetical protein n=1 Tax=Archangium lansingense TaxID=2995310 RepID=UPI003B78D188
MAREEAEARLHEKHGDSVRMKSTVYIHESGPLMGTVKARRHKIYFKDEKGTWQRKLDHLQDGLRGDIDKEERLVHLAQFRQTQGLHPIDGVFVTSAPAPFHPFIGFA